MKEIYALGVGHSTPLFIEIAEAAGWHEAGLYHYNDERTGEMDHGFKILGFFDDLYRQDIQCKYFLPTMGDMNIRHDIISNLSRRGGNSNHCSPVCPYITLCNRSEARCCNW